MAVRIYLDISRLLSAASRPTPSGIERVELAYAQHFGRRAGTRFVAPGFGRLHFLPNRFALAYIETLAATWHTASAGRAKTIAAMLCIRLLLAAISIRALVVRRAPEIGGAVYLNLSHKNLNAPAALKNFRSRSGARLLFFIHDLIPITHPEYGRPGQAPLHCRRMDTAAALADAILVNSAATRNDLLRYFAGRPALPQIHIAHLGITFDAASCTETPVAAPPYFLILSTIEPRKNHLLLLNLWRRLAEESLPLPRLIIAGRRGWENEMVLDMLDRCETIANAVEERRVSDAQLGPLLQGATALLLPSFAEGYGLPVAEALAAGTPVICSNLPALREIGGDVPEYLDPLDGPAWRQAILDYAHPGSPRRAAQCNRLQSWSAPGWDSHFRQVCAVIEGLFPGG